MAAKEKDPEVTDIPEEDLEDWLDTGPLNTEEADWYVDKMMNIFDMMSNMLEKDNKDALPTTIRNLCKLMGHHWLMITDADPKIVIKAILDPACVYLQQHLTPEGLQAIKPLEDVPKGWDFICKLPEKQQCHKETQLIIDTLDHASEAFNHANLVCANLSSLTKITNNKDTLHMVMKATI